MYKRQDSDEAGQALQAELIRRLGSEVCYIATFDDCKDANEYLQKHGKQQLAERISSSRPVPLEMSRHLGTLKTKSQTLYVTGLNLDIKLAWRILITSFRLTLVSLLLLLVFRVAGNQILSIRWLLAITKTMAGKRRLLVRKMSQLTFTRIS